MQQHPQHERTSRQPTGDRRATREIVIARRHANRHVLDGVVGAPAEAIPVDGLAPVETPVQDLDVADAAAGQVGPGRFRGPADTAE